jgi:hypothetical protein
MIEKSKSRLEVRSAFSKVPEASEAIRDVGRQLDQSDASVVALFVSPRYDLQEAAREIERSFEVPVIGCTTSGEITPEGYAQHSVTGFSVSSDELTASSCFMPSLRDLDTVKLEATLGPIRERLADMQKTSPETRAFGLLLIDGLSGMEEFVTAVLGNALRDIPIVGGSAGDDLAFRQTFVYQDGSFIPGAAVFTLFVTTLPFSIIKTQHFIASDTRLVITRAAPEKRLVYEINGRPAAEEYAAIIGRHMENLEPTTFSEYPLMLRLGGQYYVRSIQRVGSDGSLTFFCAIDEGLVLRLGRGENLVDNLKSAFRAARRDVPHIKLTIGCDCILRRLEVADKALEPTVNEVLKENHVIGFNTYGEQYQSVHINQTFTGIALGE